MAWQAPEKMAKFGSEERDGPRPHPCPERPERDVAVPDPLPLLLSYGVGLQFEVSPTVDPLKTERRRPPNWPRTVHLRPINSAPN